MMHTFPKELHSIESYVQMLYHRAMGLELALTRKGVIAMHMEPYRFVVLVSIPAVHSVLVSMPVQTHRHLGNPFQELTNPRF